MTTTPPRKRRRWLISAFKIFVLVLVILGVRHTLTRAADALREQSWSVANLDGGWLAAAAGLYLVGLFPSVIFWRRVLATVAHAPHWVAATSAYYVGHLGKYVPGKALVIVLRAGLLRSEGISAAAATVSVFYETFSTMAVGAALSVVVLAVSGAEPVYLLAIALALAFATGVPTIPRVFIRVAQLAGVGRLSPETHERLAHLNMARLGLAWLGVVVGWLFVGASLWATLAAIGAESSGHFVSDLMFTTAAAAMAVVAGFVSLIPGGLVVRNVVLLELLAPRFGYAPALVATIVVRVVWLVSEVAASSILYGYTSFRHRHPSG